MNYDDERNRLVTKEEWQQKKGSYHLITNDGGNIRQVDSDSLDEKLDLLEADASFDCLPSCNSLDQDNRPKDLDVYILDNKNLFH